MKLLAPVPAATAFRPPAFEEGVTVGAAGVASEHEGPALKTVTYSPFWKLCALATATVDWPLVVFAVVLEYVANFPYPLDVHPVVEVLVGGEGVDGVGLRASPRA